MKTLTLKLNKENIQGRQTVISTVDLLKIAVNNVPKDNGMNIEEMQTRLRLMNILNEHGEFEVKDGVEYTDTHFNMKKEISFEDADFRKLRDLFNEVKWSMEDGDLILFYSFMRDATGTNIAVTTTGGLTWQADYQGTNTTQTWGFNCTV